MRFPANPAEILYTTRVRDEPEPKEKPDVITQFNFLGAWLKAHTKSERGAAMVEYALLLALIAIVAIAALRLLGGTVSNEFSSINSGLNA